MNKFQTALSVVLFLNAWLVAATQAASIKAWNRSVQLSPLRGYVTVGGWFQVHFTSSDGTSTSWPRTYVGPNGTAGSGELAQSGTSSYFETEYLTYYESLGYFGAYGAIGLFMPTTDSNGNTIPDWMEREMSANFSASGTEFMDYPYNGTGTATAYFTRAAGSLTGTYSLSVPGAPTMYGTWTVGYATGSIAYDRTAGLAAFAVYVNDGEIQTAGAALSTANHNQVTIGSATFRYSLSGPITTSSVGNTSFTRSGNRYRASMTFQDGDNASPWADFTRWVVEITDTVDGDGDGVPDFSDALLSPPVIQRTGSTPRFDWPVTPGYTYRIRMSTDLVNWSDHATHTASGSTWQFTPPAGQKGFFRILSP